MRSATANKEDPGGERKAKGGTIGDAKKKAGRKAGLPYQALAAKNDPRAGRKPRDYKRRDATLSLMIRKDSHKSSLQNRFVEQGDLMINRSFSSASWGPPALSRDS